MNMTRRVGVLFVSCFLLALLVACAGREPITSIDLPATPVLTIQASWCVVVAPYLRLRKEPNVSSAVIAHLRNRSIAEIVARTTTPETVEGRTNFWYQINADGLRGWVFGSHIDLHDSRGSAERAVRESTDG